MLYAQLGGKLRWEQENLEDLLTSNVFGAFKHVSVSLGLVPFLRRAEGAHARELIDAVADEITDVSYEFWPRLASCEPDVLIRLSPAGGPRLLVLVEAKFRSGKSSEASAADRPISDQLAREWESLVQRAQVEQRRPFLVYVTADYVSPAGDIARSQAELRAKHGAEGKIVWLSWRVLREIARPAGSPLLDDLVRLLVQRYSLSSFDGITSPAARFTWRFETADRNPRVMRWTFTGKLRWRFDLERAAGWRLGTHNPWRWNR